MRTCLNPMALVATHRTSRPLNAFASLRHLRLVHLVVFNLQIKGFCFQLRLIRLFALTSKRNYDVYLCIVNKQIQETAAAQFHGGQLGAGCLPKREQGWLDVACSASRSGPKSIKLQPRRFDGFVARNQIHRQYRPVLFHFHRFGIERAVRASEKAVGLWLWRLYLTKGRLKRCNTQVDKHGQLTTCI